MKKLICVMIMAAALVLVGCSGGYSSQEPCEWCGKTPTKQIASDTVDTEAGYYCEECSNTCFGCEGQATHHYTNVLGIEVFVCDECM